MPDAQVSSDFSLKIRPYRHLDDFTRYLSCKSRGLTEIKRRFQPQEDGNKVYSVQARIGLEGSGNFRGLICPCFAGTQYSLTLRRGNDTGADDAPETNQPPASSRTGKNHDKDPSQYRVNKEDPKPGYLFGRDKYVESIFDAVMGSEIKKTGLVVVAGSTATGKSTIARGMIYNYLTRLIKARDGINDRRPHLVTFEDPIEVFYYKDPRESLQWGLDYTPRQKGQDAALLREVLQDCLRQTPDAVYVGETRDLSDWRSIVDFAGTGHLIFTTCHAGSLAEVMATLFAAVKADTAAKRSALVGRLAAVVHLRRAVLDVPDPIGLRTRLPTMEATLPATFRRTSTAINALSSDGLAALLPHAASELKDASRYCLGRRHFANCFADTLTALENGEEYARALRERAVQCDLEGV